MPARSLKVVHDWLQAEPASAPHEPPKRCRFSATGHHSGPESQARRRSDLGRPDYEVNLKVEIEIIALHEKLDAVRTQQFEELLAKQQEQLDLLTRLVAQLDNKTNS